MKDTLLHTPEGVRDLYGKECAKKIAIQDKLHKILHLYGYKDIQTPTFEFFDIFSRERGTIDAKDMYKFFDRDGNTLVLRPDITPSIARNCAKYFAGHKIPYRLCYIGNIFINNRSYQGRLKESTQLGAELIGAKSSTADAEMIAMVIDSLLESGLTEFQIDIGQVDFFKGIVEDAGIDFKTEKELRTMIENKNNFGVETIVDQLMIPKEVKNILMKLPSLFGSLEILEYAKQITASEKSMNAIKRLEEVYEILGYYGFQKYITFDLGMLSEFDYYTGIIFKGYSYGQGEAIVNGGRYDKLVEQFGWKTEAIGFGIIIDELLQALSRQNIEIEVDNTLTLIVYKSEYLKEAIGLANTIRNAEASAEMIRMQDNQTIEDYIEYADEGSYGGILFIEDKTKLKSISMETKEVKELEIKDLI